MKALYGEAMVNVQVRSKDKCCSRVKGTNAQAGQQVTSRENTGLGGQGVANNMNNDSKFENCVLENNTLNNQFCDDASKWLNCII